MQRVISYYTTYDNPVLTGQLTWPSEVCMFELLVFVVVHEAGFIVMALSSLSFLFTLQKKTK